MKYAAIASMRSSYPVRLCCALLEVSASGFYAWTTRKPRQTTDACDRVVVAAAHEKTRGRSRFSEERIIGILRQAQAGLR